MVALKIPDEDLKVFAELARLSDSELSALATALNQARPTLRVDDLVAVVAQKSGIQGTIVDAIIRLLATMDFLRATHEVPLTTVVDGIRRALSEAPIPPEFGIDLDKVTERLSSLLLPEPLFVTAKALGVIRDHQRALCEARIITDIRPVFGSEGQPVAAGIVHVLKLTYHEGPKRALRDVFMAMDSSDLKDLQNVVNRALRKESQLKPLLSLAGLIDLEEEPQS